MSIRPTSVQALQDNGVGAAASLLGNNIGTFAGMLNQRAKNKNDIIEALLGQAGTGVRESLTSARESRQGREGLEAAAQIMPELAGLKIPDGLKIDPTTTNTLINANSLARLLTGASKKATIGKIGSEAGIPEAGVLIADAVEDATGHGGSGTPTVPRAPSPQPSEEQVPTQSTPGGPFKGGVSATSTPDPAATTDNQGNFIYRAKKADLTTKETQAKKATNISGALDNFTKLSSLPEGSEVFDPLVGEGGALKGLKVNPVTKGLLSAAQAEYSDSPGKFSARRAKSFAPSKAVIDLVSLTGDLEKYLDPGLGAQIARNAKTNEYTINLTGNKADAKARAQAGSIAARLSKVARALGEVGTLTDTDINRVKQAIPNLLSGKANFDATNDELHKLLLGPVAAEAVSTLDSSTWNQANSLFRNRFGRDYALDDPGGMQALSSTNKNDFSAFRPNIEMRSEALPEVQSVQNAMTPKSGPLSIIERYQRIKGR